MESLAVKGALAHVAPQVIPAMMATVSGLLLFAAQAVEPVANTATESNFLTLMASVLASTGVVGYAVKRFVDAQITRAEDQRKAERDERAQERDDRIDSYTRLVAHYETQITLWQSRYTTLEERHDRIYAQLIEELGRRDAA